MRPIRLHILSGASAGLVREFDRDSIVAGRHADADLRFNAERDLEVSGHHAVIEREAGRWRVRDLGSTNGTFVNGARVSGAVPLRAGDRIAFGAGGPVAEVTILDAAPAAAGAPESPTQRIRVAVARETRRLRLFSLALILLLAAAAAALVYSSRRQQAAWSRERAALVERIDRLLDASRTAVASLQGQVAGLAAALDDSRSEVRRLRDALERAHARGDSSSVLELRRQLQAATSALERQQLAASLDFPAIQQANRPAVALVYVESEAGDVVTATAFAVRPDATLLTSRHVVAGADGRGRPRRIAVQFSDSDQVWPARLLALSDDADLAVIRAGNIMGDVPTVRLRGSAPQPVARGAAVALIGFPLGGQARLPRAGAARLVTPIVSAGIVRATAPDRIEIQGYGAAGASGSPIFDARGALVAVLFGGRADAGGRTLLAVPAAEALRLLSRVP